MTGPCPEFPQLAATLRDPGGNRVEQAKQRNGRTAASCAIDARLENPVHFSSELAAEGARVCEQREAVEDPGERIDDGHAHRRESGSSRWARAASTWSARRLASALATSRPCAVIR